MWYTMLRKAVAAAFAFGAVLAHAEYPDPERYRAAIEAFLASEADAPPPKNAVVATGSSSMRFWHRRIGEDLAPLTIIPRGFGGSNMRDVRHFLDELVLRHEPRAVLLYEGDNDAAVGATPEQVLEHFDAIVATIHERLPATRIYALSVKPSVARWHLRDVMGAINAQFTARAEADPLITPYRHRHAHAGRRRTAKEAHFRGRHAAHERRRLRHLARHGASRAGGGGSGIRSREGRGGR